MTPYQLHVQQWKSCKLCPLCEGRTNVVLARGRIPCDVLFIGEAPGASEDILGKPFVGPAGKLLDRIIDQAWETVGFRGKHGEPTFGFTNLVACIPLGDDGDKVKEPPKESIEACAPRLADIVHLCNPKLIVCVGALASKWVPKIAIDWTGIRVVDIIHPAAILRMDISQRGLAIQRCVVAIADAISEL